MSMTNTAMGIYQMSTSYDFKEDRIRLRVSTSCKNELVLWFTRRMTLALLPQLQQIEENNALKGAPTTEKLLGNEGKKVAQKSHRKTLLAETDFDTPYKEREEAHEASQDSLLVVEVNITSMKDKSYIVRFADAKSKEVADGADVNAYSLSFKEKMFVSFIHLLETQLKAAKWQA